MQDTQNSITLSQALLELHSSASQPSSSSYHASSNGGSQPTPILTHSAALNSLLSVRYGTIHEICGAPGTGKTGVALDLTSQCLEAGHRVLWLTTRGRAASLPLGQTGVTKDQSPALSQKQQESQLPKRQQQQRRLKAPERTWRQLGHMCVDGVSQLIVLFTQWWNTHSYCNQGTRLVVIDDFAHLLRGVPPRMVARVLFEMKRAAQEHGFAVIVVSRLLMQWSVTGRRMMMVPGLPALNGVLDGRIVLCRGGGKDGSGRIAARVLTSLGPDQAIMEVVRHVQFEVLADCVVDTVEKRSNDFDDTDDNNNENDVIAARPEKRRKLRSATDPGAAQSTTINIDDEDGFSEVDFDDLIKDEKNDGGRKKKSLLRKGNDYKRSTLQDEISSNGSHKTPTPALQGFMTSGELMQSMIENGDLSSSNEEGSTSPVRPKEVTPERTTNSLVDIVDIASSPAGYTEAASSPVRPTGDISDPYGTTAAITQEKNVTKSTVLSACKETNLALSPTLENIEKGPTEITVENSTLESNASDGLVNKISCSPQSFVDISSFELEEANSSPCAHSAPPSSLAVVNVLSQDEPGVAENISSSSSPPSSFPEAAAAAAAAADPSFQTKINKLSPAKSLEIADSQDFGSDEIKLPDDFIPSSK